MNCPICDSGDTRRIRRVPGSVLYHCRACDVGFADPMRAATAEWYAASPLYLNVKALHVPLGWHHGRFLDHAGPGAGRTLLDVGCGTGTFLAQARDRGFVPAGLDFDAGNIRIARQRYGLQDVHALSVDDFARREPGTGYDAVTLFEVVEHVEDPRALLRSARALMAPGGVLAFSTPNRNRTLDTLRDGDWPPNHLTRWSARAVRTLVESAGFKLEAVEIKPFDASEIAGWLRARIRFGVARRLLTQGVAAGDPETVQRAAAIMGVKERLLNAVAWPLAPAARALGAQGSGMVAIASVRP